MMGSLRNMFLSSSLFAAVAVSIAVLQNGLPNTLSDLGAALDYICVSAASAWNSLVFATVDFFRNRERRSTSDQFRKIIAIRNFATLPADLHLDDGLLGVRIASLESGAPPLHLSVRSGDRFFFTKRANPERFVNASRSLVEFVVDDDMLEFSLPSDSEPQGQLCLDRFKICQREASRGSCRKLPGWMVANCCASCDTVMNASKLMDPKIRCNRTFLNTSGSRAWRAGDVDHVFQNITQSIQWKNARVLASPPSGPWLLLLDKFLTTAESTALIEVGEEQGFKQSSVHKAGDSTANVAGEHDVISDTNRTSRTSWCSKAKCVAGKPVVRQIIRKVENLIGVRSGNFEPLQILSYDPGQSCAPHLDSKGWMADIAAGLRILTILFILRSADVGGETAFSKLGLRSAPDAGSALIWPNVMSDNPDEVDGRLLHESLVVQNGTKFAANLWVHMYDVDFAETWGC